MADYAYLPVNRALHPSDYDHPDLSPFVAEVLAFERTLSNTGAPFRKDHEHRVWEYANVLRQLASHGVPLGATILDTGSGGSYLPALLACKGYLVVASDSMVYGDCTEWVYRQCVALGIRLPIIRNAVEDLVNVDDEGFDVALCISVIEHVDAARYEDAWRELSRVTKRGGLVMVTSDYFESAAAWEASPYRQIQHTAFRPEVVEEFRATFPMLELAGGVDLTYRGSFVNNYSFLNLCAIKRA